MEDHETPEAVAKRAAQVDPIVMYLIVRTSLNMSVGKLSAQVGHAVGMQMLQYFRRASPMLPQNNIFEAWLNTSYRKITLGADEKEWAKLKELYKKPEAVIVVDAGLTELEPNTETVMGLLPMRKSERPKLVKRLQALK